MAYVRSAGSTRIYIFISVSSLGHYIICAHALRKCKFRDHSKMQSSANWYALRLFAYKTSALRGWCWCCYAQRTKRVCAGLYIATELVFRLNIHFATTTEPGEVGCENCNYNTNYTIYWRKLLSTCYTNLYKLIFGLGYGFPTEDIECFK